MIGDCSSKICDVVIDIGDIVHDEGDVVQCYLTCGVHNSLPCGLAVFKNQVVDRYILSGYVEYSGLSVSIQNMIVSVYREVAFIDDDRAPVAFIAECIIISHIKGAR